MKNCISPFSHEYIYFVFLRGKVKLKRLIKITEYKCFLSIIARYSYFTKKKDVTS